jgi:hypothetical protein
MKAYKQELTEVYSKKSTIDEKMKKKLKKAQSLDKKKEVFESFKQEREEDKVDDDELSLIRKPYIRITDYLKQKDDQIKLLYEQFNEYKLNILYENINTNVNPEIIESEIKRFEVEIEALNQLKIKQILKINSKKEDLDKIISDLKIKISERQQEYNETETIEDKKHIYVETVALKLQLFEIIRKNMSIVNIESKTNDSVMKYSTIVIDYMPIKNNQKKMINDGEMEQGKAEQREIEEGKAKQGKTEQLKANQVDLGEIDLGEVELSEADLGKVGPPSPQYRPSEH